MKTEAEVREIRDLFARHRAIMVAEIARLGIEPPGLMAMQAAMVDCLRWVLGEKTPIITDLIDDCRRVEEKHKDVFARMAHRNN